MVVGKAAAVVIQHELILAIRNEKDFMNLETQLLNPWPGGAGNE